VQDRFNDGGQHGALLLIEAFRKILSGKKDQLVAGLGQIVCSINANRNPAGIVGVYVCHKFAVA
jgi:hypothetical protein|tara:strand:+ start:858 stop:1049 length:192 start_codon:yes stop_codon:yes gene_type:complete